MNKVITINLGGNAYQLEEGGYDALRVYLETATARLAGNPDRDEILSDIERAIADKFRALLARQKTVVEAKEVAAILADMGPIEADSDAAKEASSSAPGGAGAAGESRSSAGSIPPRRLYRIREGAMLAGVCNGFAAYVNVDPTLVRLGFVFLTMFWGTGLLVYIVLAIVIPEAVSPEEKAAASGMPSTAQEFIRRAKEGYYEATKNFPDRKARREWSRQFRRDMRANAAQWSQNWHSYWSEHTPVHPGMGIALPFLSLLNGVAMILFVCSLISLLATGSVFGRPLPGDLPVWGAAVVLLLVYAILTGPLKLARRACYRGMGPAGWSWSIFFLLDSVIWVGVVAVLVFLATLYFPEVRNAFHSAPALLHQATDDIRAWWNQK
ncbi:MAG TPA: PspC domain-containing protein [Candidatus Acidoferrum sp.]|nr:PspC domain-containing protein [Candidatus Acidoferrum sp.]